ncbi:MAG: adenylosuccinate lyase [Sandaracinaceae bacterium]|nr:adenylosuccinate lyase [Sandaracinaceae bacterium]
MIPRYTPPDMARLFSAEEKYRTWLEVELAACEAMEEAGLVPEGTSASLRPLAERLDPARIETIEKECHHDVIAFLTHLEELGGSTARWLHRGMTSSDVVDTALALTLRRAACALIERLDQVIGLLATQVAAHRRTPMMGRTHGMHAEPTTFGFVLGSHLAEFLRARERMLLAREEISYGKISGAVGNHAHLDPEIEARALGRLGLRPEPIATQVVPRDRHAFFCTALAFIASAIERFATNLRHLQRSEVFEAAEPFEVGQKGSSAMPHKRNPVMAENLCGLARLVRAALIPAFENIALWHERDISHSAIERTLLPDAVTALAFMLDRLLRILRGMEIYPEQMAHHIEQSQGLWASEALLLALVERGLGRQEAYRIVQRNAMRALAKEGSFRNLVLEDPEIIARISSAEIEKLFDLSHAIRHVDHAIDRLLLQAQRPKEGLGTAEN